MAKISNFAEYTKIRDIVVKRNKRAAAAGLMPLVHFPTVKEIKSGYVDPAQAMRFLKEYYSGGSQVKAIRQTGIAPEVKQFPVMPKPKALTSEEKLQKRRERQKDYRRRKKVRDAAVTPEKGKRYEGYLKALETVTRTWRRAGVDIGLDLKSMTPTQAQAFVEYMDYRFSQGDFKQRYVIDEFIQDFSKLLSKGHTANSIVGDFNKFLENRYQMSSRADAMEGISSGQFMGLWDEFTER